MEKIRSYITEFEVVQPANNLEKAGQKIDLMPIGSYQNENGGSGYSLIYLLENPSYYRVSEIVMCGAKLKVPNGRSTNYAKAIQL